MSQIGKQAKTYSLHFATTKQNKSEKKMRKHLETKLIRHKRIKRREKTFRRETDFNLSLSEWFQNKYILNNILLQLS